tara:strand:- start:5883 stop:6137 length:255 start_codon:yes stop_codon:yes gene_type:complete
MVLLSGLPLDKSNFLAPYYEAIVNDEKENPGSSSNTEYRNSKHEYDRKANRRGGPRSRMSLDDFIAQSDGLGNKTTLKDISKEE